MTRVKKIGVTLSVVALVLTAQLAFGHVTIRPDEASVGGTQQYTMRVPHERAGSTVRIEVDFPAEARVAYFETKPGWTIEHKTDADGRIIAAMWSGGSIGEHEFTEFSFLVRNPREATTLVFGIRQIYADGNVSEWSPEVRVHAEQQ